MYHMRTLTLRFISNFEERSVLHGIHIGNIGKHVCIDQKSHNNGVSHSPKTGTTVKLIPENWVFLRQKEKKLCCSYQLVVYKDQGMTRSQNFQCAYRNLAHISLCFFRIRQAPNSSELLCSSNDNEFIISKSKEPYTLNFQLPYHVIWRECTSLIETTQINLSKGKYDTSKTEVQSRTNTNSFETAAGSTSRVLKTNK